MDVLGLTFDEVLAETRPQQQEIKLLRKAYRKALEGDGSNGQLMACPPTIVRHTREDQVAKFAVQLDDGAEVECVMVPMQRRARKWNTLCVSSQAGCARRCVFCETGQLGLHRNLTAREIVGQLVAVRREFNANIRNVVFMGMGEPLDNLDAVIQALHVLTDRSGLSLSRERLTISTAGVAAGIRRLAQLGWRRLNLAVSLNAPNDELRARIMPIARLEPIAQLREAIAEYLEMTQRYVMAEYVLIPGLNDAREHALELAEYTRPLRAVVNVIPYNPRRDSPWPAPTEESIGQFIRWLEEAGQIAKRRLTKGRGLMAACGQLGTAPAHRRTD